MSEYLPRPEVPVTLVEKHYNRLHATDLSQGIPRVFEVKWQQQQLLVRVDEGYKSLIDARIREYGIRVSSAG